MSHPEHSPATPRPEFQSAALQLPAALQLQRWLELGLVRPLDVALIQMLQSHPVSAETCDKAKDRFPAHFWLWLALGSSQLAQGHLCLDLQQAFLNPDSLQNAAQRSKSSSLELSNFVQNQQLSQVLALLATAELLVDVRTEPQLEEGMSGRDTTATPFVLEENRLYLRRYWRYEQQIAIFIRQSQQQTQRLRAEFPIVAQAWLLGGHIRVGMEDNIYLEKGVLCESNAQLVSRAQRIIGDLGGQLASSNEARQMLGL